MGDLILNVKKEWFELIQSGQKTVEYRQVKSYWTRRLGKRYDNVIIVLGYPKKRDNTNSCVFKYSGYFLTQVSPHEVSYDDTIKTLSVTEPEFVYGIKLEKRCSCVT